MIPAFTRYRSSGSGDPYFSSVALLLHLDGANGSTSFPDRSSNALPITNSGGATISTAQSKFGGASLGLSGGQAIYGSSYTSAIDIMAPSTSYTVECWVYLNSTSGDPYIVSGKPAATFNRWAMQLSGGKLSFYTESGGSSQSYTGSISMPTGTWVHLAVVYDATAGTMKLFVGGVLDVNSSTAPKTTTDTMRVEIGAAFFNGSNYVNGYIDDVRITKGVARYSASFTPPTAAFPDHI